MMNEIFVNYVLGYALLLTLHNSCCNIPFRALNINIRTKKYRSQSLNGEKSVVLTAFVLSRVTVHLYNVAVKICRLVEKL